MVTGTIEAILKERTQELMTVPGVVGTAEGLCGDRPCIKVYVLAKTPELERRIPSVLGGFPVTLEETGPIRVQRDDQG